jgi:hypothetical protein
MRKTEVYPLTLILRKILRLSQLASFTPYKKKQHWAKKSGIHKPTLLPQYSCQQAHFFHLARGSRPEITVQLTLHEVHKQAKLISCRAINLHAADVSVQHFSRSTGQTQYHISAKRH